FCWNRPKHNGRPGCRIDHGHPTPVTARSGRIAIIRPNKPYIESRAGVGRGFRLFELPPEVNIVEPLTGYPKCYHSIPHLSAGGFKGDLCSPTGRYLRPGCNRARKLVADDCVRLPAYQSEAHKRPI